MTRRLVLLLCVGLIACDGCEDPPAKNNNQNNTPNNINRPDASADLPVDLDMTGDMKGNQDQGRDRSADLNPDQDMDQSSDHPSDQANDQPSDANMGDMGGDDMRGDISVDLSADMGGDQTNDMNPLDMAPDASMGDMTPDMTQSPCLSGGNGKYVVRFKWLGNGSGSRAYVRYEANTLPDTSRWKAGANARNVGYQPVFQDTFLGEGGLQMSGTVFMDVELSTQGASYTKATLAIFGRSYNTTSPGSFRWQTFSGVGNSTYGGVSNSAPYQWYTADASSALPVGNAGTLLRIYPEGPSNALIVRQVEICFE